MLLLWCLSMTQVFSYPLGKRSFHLFVDLKQSIVSVSGWLSPHNFEMYSIRPYQYYSFPCLSHLTEVLCPLLKFFSSYQVLHNFSTGVLPEVVFPCSSFLTSVFSFVVSVVFFSRNGLTFSRFFGLTRLSKKQLSFTSSLPLPFLSGAILDVGTRSSRSGGVL